MDGAFAPPLVVSPSAIESTLNEIWEQLASQEGGKKMRACLFNLILVTQNTPRADYIRGLAQRVIEKFPSRIILVCIEKGKTEESFTTSVAVVGPYGRTSDIACDFIEFSVAEKSSPRIPFGVLPHLVPDLPVYLLWADDPIQENPLSHQLESFSSRLIFDSESTDDLPLFAKSLLHHHNLTHCDIADLNWARTENWRTLLLSTFQSPQRLKELANTSSIHIEYNALETTFFCHTEIQSIYIQGWLACQLGWHFQTVASENNKRTFTYKNDAQLPIFVELSPTIVSELAPGALVSFTLETHEGEHFKFVRNPLSPHEMTLYLSSREKCELPAHFLLTKGGIGLTLVKEICRKGTSIHYIRLLEFLASLEMQWI